MRIPSLIVHKKGRIEIIPLIDIMFFLLASFMMVSLSQVHMKGMKVMLPTGQSGEIQAKNNYISVSVNENGNMFFDKQEMTPDAMLQKLQVLHQSDPDAKVFIRGDANTVHGNIIHLLDILRAAGFLKVSFEIKSEAARGVPGPGT